MSNDATIQVSSLAAAGARSAAHGPSGTPTWQPCPTVASAVNKAIRVWMHDGYGFLTTRRLKERSSP